MKKSELLKQNEKVICERRITENCLRTYQGVILSFINDAFVRVLTAKGVEVLRVSEVVSHNFIMQRNVVTKMKEQLFNLNTLRPETTEEIKTRNSEIRKLKNKIKSIEVNPDYQTNLHHWELNQNRRIRN